jgi:hypothetical protein
MRGETNPVISRGNMPSPDFEKLISVHREFPISYAVWSYGTIIGYKWCGQWTIPDCTYSITTTVQQNKLRVAIGDYAT